MSITEIQEKIKTKLEENVFFAQHNIPILCENLKDIEYQIQNSLASLGICVTILTPHISFGGEYSDENSPFWTVDNAQIIVAEQPTTNRSKADSTTAQDTALQVALTLNDSRDFNLKDIQETTDNGFVFSTVNFKTNLVFRYAKTDLSNNNKQEEN